MRFHNVRFVCAQRIQVSNVCAAKFLRSRSEARAPPARRAAWRACHSHLARVAWRSIASRTGHGAKRRPSEVGDVGQLVAVALDVVDAHPVLRVAPAREPRVEAVIAGVRVDAFAAVLVEGDDAPLRVVEAHGLEGQVGHGVAPGLHRPEGGGIAEGAREELREVEVAEARARKRVHLVRGEPPGAGLAPARGALLQGLEEGLLGEHPPRGVLDLRAGEHGEGAAQGVARHVELHVAALARLRLRHKPHGGEHVGADGAPGAQEAPVHAHHLRGEVEALHHVEAGLHLVEAAPEKVEIEVLVWRGHGAAEDEVEPEGRLRLGAAAEGEPGAGRPARGLGAVLPRGGEHGEGVEALVAEGLEEVHPVGMEVERDAPKVGPDGRRVVRDGLVAVVGDATEVGEDEGEVLVEAPEVGGRLARHGGARRGHGRRAPYEALEGGGCDAGLRLDRLQGLRGAVEPLALGVQETRAGGREAVHAQGGRVPRELEGVAKGRHGARSRVRERVRCGRGGRRRRRRGPEGPRGQ
mmetsp:Transcript_3309/g.10959  ORF Transcript_3309/g.10959 Transcript_3309/m.10959 type:complete len:524 (-) Transcript_3309:380-1951(-)